ncbi:MAG: hypothetical protein ACETVZ_01890 [Phycisphaerae bacterium]
MINHAHRRWVSAIILRMEEIAVLLMNRIWEPVILAARALRCGKTDNMRK